MSNIEQLAEAYANNLVSGLQNFGIEVGKEDIVRLAARKAFYEGEKAMLGLTIGTLADMYKEQFKEEWKDGQRND